MLDRVENTKRMLRMQPGYVGTREAANALIDDMAKALREISKHHGNQDMNHVDYRVMAKTLADEALSNSEAKSAPMPELQELLEALHRWYRAKHHGTTEDEELQAELLAIAYSKYLDAKTEAGAVAEMTNHELYQIAFPHGVDASGSR